MGRAHPCTCSASCVNTAAVGQWLWIETYCTSQSQEAGASRNILSKNCQFRASSFGKRIAHRWKACLEVNRLSQMLFCSIFISAGLTNVLLRSQLVRAPVLEFTQSFFAKTCLLKGKFVKCDSHLRSKNLSLIGIRLYLDWCEITLMSYRD